jgi:biopolymer transport protein ExbD
VSPDAVLLNGLPVTEARLSDALASLMPTLDAVVVLRATGGADVQRMIDVLQLLQAQGFSSVAIVP